MVRHGASLLQPIVLVAVVVTAWLLFAPSQVGGRAGYAVVDGNSMEPTLYRGALAVLRRTGDYTVGDVVTYRDPYVGMVIHRIVADDAGRLTLQGDNNTWLDPYQPTAAEVEGELWFHIPNAGRLLAAFRTPLRMTVLAVLLGVLILMSLFSADTAQNTAPDGAPQRTSAASTADLAVLFGVIAALALIFGFMAFRHSLSEPAATEVPYQHNGTFRYEASAAGDVYDAGLARTGDPIFFQVSDTLALTFDYAFIAAAEHELSGTYRLDAVITERNGWSRTVALLPETPFEGDILTASAVLDLQTVRSAIVAYQQQTGVQRRDYTLALQPQVAVRGAVAGRPVEETFSPVLAFSVDEMQMWLPRQEGTADLLAPMQGGAVSLPTERPAVLTVLGVKVPVAAARWAASLAALVGVAGLIVTLRAVPVRAPRLQPAEPAPDLPAPPPAPPQVVRPSRRLNAAQVVPAAFALATVLTVAGMLVLVIALGGSAAAAPAVGGPLAVQSAEARPLPADTVAVAGGAAHAPFHIDRIEVTNGGWQACVDAGTCAPLPAAPGLDAASTSPDMPVVNVTRAEAAAFCAWRGSRLPSEAEWRAAAYFDTGANAERLYPWGDAWLADRANVCGEECAPDDPAHITAGIRDAWPRLAPADSLPEGASPAGALHMAGNAAEWVSDGDGDTDVARGGAWNLEPGWAAAGARLAVPAGVRSPAIGFRCASPVEQVAAR